VNLIKAIVAVDAGWGIGYKGALLARIPEDQHFFAQTTLGGIVIMGSETFYSLPNRQPLRDRINIVLTKKTDITNEKVVICSSLEELMNTLKKYNGEKSFVIGGESVYMQLLPICEEAIVTRFHKRFMADRYFPDLEQAQGWRLKSSEELRSFDGLEYGREIYENLRAGDFHI